MHKIFSSKLSAKGYFLVSLLWIGTTNVLQSQNPGGVKGQALWIKAKESTGTDKEFAKKEQKEYFNFNSLYESNETTLKYKRILQNNYSLFLVFRSDLEEETSILRLKTFDEKIEITNRKAGDDISGKFKDVDVKKGMILNYNVSSAREIPNKGNVLSILNLSQPNSPEGQKNELMEFVYYPRILSKKEHKQIESYLSIKYGISLLGEADYVNSDSKKVWDYEKNEAFNYRVTGIGRDDYYDLYQKQSGNSTKDGLYIGLKNLEISNELNKNTVPDKTFLLWGDNNGTTALKNNNNKEAGDFKQMKRIWKMQVSSGNPNSEMPTQVVLDKKAFAITNNATTASTSTEFVWLVVSGNAESDFDFPNAKFYKARENENQLVFDNVEWDADKNGSDLFTFIKAPDFFITYASTAPDCNLSESGKLNVSIIGGSAPFTLDVTSQNYNTSITTNDRVNQFSAIPEGDYSIIVTDNFQMEKTGQLKQDIFKNISVTLDPQWQLSETGGIKVSPNVLAKKNDELVYKWEYNGTIVSKGRELETNKAGDYQLTITNKQGCEKKLSCHVRDYYKEGEHSWSISPNPTREKQPFTVSFDLEKLSDVVISYYDMSSRLIKSKKLGMIRRFEYTDSLAVTGTYVIVVTIDGKSESSKLIIK